MAIVVTPNLTTASTADSTTGFVGTSGGLDSQIFKQGTGSFTYQTPENGIGSCVFTAPAPIDVSIYPKPHVYWIMRCDVFPFCETIALGGLQLKVTDNTGNWIVWNVSGSDEWDGRWATFIVNLNNLSSQSSNSVNTLLLTELISFEFITDNSNSGTIRIIDNTWIDVIRIGSGLTTSSDLLYNISDISDIDGDVLNYYSVVSEDNGVYFINGSVSISNNFNSVNELIVLKDGILSGSFQQLIGVDVEGLGNTQTITFDGSTIKNNSRDTDLSDSAASIFDMSLSNVYLNMSSTSLQLIRDVFLNFGVIDSSSFSNCSGVELSSTSNMVISNSNFNASSILMLGLDSTLNSCNINGYLGFPFTEVYQISVSNLEQLVKCTFNTENIESVVPIQLTSLGNGTMNWDNKLTQATKAIHVTPSSGTLTINVLAGASVPIVTSNGAVVTVVSGQVTTKITVIDIDTLLPIVGARVLLKAAETTSDFILGDDILTGETDVNGVISTTFSLNDPININGRVRMATTSPFYKTSNVIANISNISGLDLTVQMIIDE